ncbi:MAG: hypothetical protein A4E49_02778 [Methanosaeta sp. PtaU1.Bin112]|nr:MAG: hypothetical protein A4E49_02778 [Methanosaeta sp. PtaU1.Bin112]
MLDNPTLYRMFKQTCKYHRIICARFSAAFSNKAVEYREMQPICHIANQIKDIRKSGITLNVQAIIIRYRIYSYRFSTEVI